MRYLTQALARVIARHRARRWARRLPGTTHAHDRRVCTWIDARLIEAGY